MFVNSSIVSSIAIEHKQFNLTPVICLHIVKWLNSFIWHINGTLTATTTLGQSGPGSNGNKGILHISQSFRTEAALIDDLVSYPGMTHWGGVLPLCRDTVSVFY